MSNDDWKSKYENLIRLIEHDGGPGIYPMGHLKEVDRDKLKGTDAYKCGWNAAHMEATHRLGDIMSKAESIQDNNLTMLLAAEAAHIDGNEVSLNMNDTWAWALAWWPVVPQDQIKEVARLFSLYGNAGLMYWHSCQENNMKSEFEHVNRAIEFVRNEENIRKTIPHAKYPYHKTSYRIGTASSQSLEKRFLNWWHKVLVK